MTTLKKIAAAVCAAACIASVSAAPDDISKLNPYGLVYQGAVKTNTAGEVNIHPVTYSLHGIKIAANVYTPANYDAKQAEKQANASGSEADLAKATTLRDKAKSMKVYQLKLETVKKLKVPSDENASDITARLLKEKEFKQNLEVSIADSKEKMRRPTQQVLFKQAENALKKDPTTLTASEKVAIYKALNLSLTNHNAQEVAAQSRFYAELSKKGYNALLDYNDKEYSSYHAKRPMIVFDTDSVRLQSVTETNPKVVDKLYMRYNAERIAKEVGANTIGYVSKLGNKTVSECTAYMERKMNDYLS